MRSIENAFQLASMEILATDNMFFKKEFLDHAIMEAISNNKQENNKKNESTQTWKEYGRDFTKRMVETVIFALAVSITKNLIEKRVLKKHTARAQ